jgi:hypothetical protein
MTTKCKINLLLEIQEKIIKCTEPTQKELLEDKGRSKHNITLPGMYSPKQNTTLLRMPPK